MLQRIQTVFLLFALVAQVLFLTLTISNYTINDSETISFYAKGLVGATEQLPISSIPVLILGIIILALIFIDIFLYKKRVLQMRICIYSILLNIGMIGLTSWILISINKHIEINSQSYGLAFVMPLITIILLFLAFRGIRKDEVLVKAYDRLR